MSNTIKIIDGYYQTSSNPPRKFPPVEIVIINWKIFFKSKGWNSNEANIDMNNFAHDPGFMFFGVYPDGHGRFFLAKDYAQESTRGFEVLDKEQMFINNPEMLRVWIEKIWKINY